jgi:hypothetical protein
MRRVLLILACGSVVAGCASGSDALKSATPTLTLQFESEPAGAEVKTSNGQTCTTPCALAVPATDLMATYSLKGYESQTIPVKLVPPDDTRPDPEVGSRPQPRFDPSPVYAELEKSTSARRPARKPRPKPKAEPSAIREKPATASQSQPPMPPPSAPAPAPAPATSSPWPSNSATAPGTTWPPAPSAPSQMR